MAYSLLLYRYYGNYMINPQPRGQAWKIWFMFLFFWEFISWYRCISFPRWVYPPEWKMPVRWQTIKKIKKKCRKKILIF